jgi:hypothetical protein
MVSRGETTGGVLAPPLSLMRKNPSGTEVAFARTQASSSRSPGQTCTSFPISHDPGSAHFVTARLDRAVDELPRSSGDRDRTCFSCHRRPWSSSTVL